MLSQLSKGYGSWTAGYVDPYFGEKKVNICLIYIRSTFPLITLLRSTIVELR